MAAKRKVRSAPEGATAAEVTAWKKRTGHSIATGAVALNVHPRTFARWLAGDTQSPRWLVDRFREGKK
jgi:hypothetical protein